MVYGEDKDQPDPYMPLRVFAYDGAEYRVQLLKENKGKPLYPVVTLVLYFGYKKRWDKPIRLHEVMEIPDVLKPYVTDLKLNLFEIAYLTDEQLSYFHGDFKVVADYFTQMQRNGDYIPSHTQLQHVEAVLQLLAIMTGDKRFEEVLNESENAGEGGVKNMCEVLDRVEARGVAKGEAIGEARGVAKGEAIGEARGVAIGEARGVIKGTIKVYRDELHLPPTQIIEKIIARFPVSQEEAEQYLKETPAEQMA